MDLDDAALIRMQTNLETAPYGSGGSALALELIGALKWARKDADQWRHEYALAMKGQEEIRLRTIENSLAGVEKLRAERDSARRALRRLKKTKS